MSASSHEIAERFDAAQKEFESTNVPKPET
jgi:hypothetical protein